MTSLSRRKRRTTVRATTTPARTPASGPCLLAAALLLLAAGGAPAQEGQSTYSPRSVVLPPVAGSSPTPVARSAPVATPRGFGGMAKTAYQPPRPGVGIGAGTDGAPIIQLEPPGLERLSRIDTDEQLQERIRQETHEEVDPNETVTFPEGPILSREVYRGRAGLWPQQKMIVEPYYVCYGKGVEAFQQVNFERYGWDLGFLSPAVCAGVFFFDVAMLPYRTFREPCRCFDCSSGYCLPGDPVPLLIYPAQPSATGLVAELATIAGLIALFP